MAYEIISQNNTTTTLSDGTNTIVVPGKVVLATSSTYEITEVNNNTATLEGSDGSVIRDVPCVAVLYGGGSSDTHNKGYFATQAALEEAYPTAEPGDYAIVGATDTIWIWDEDTTAWVDTDTKGQVQSVNSKTGVVVLDANDVGAVPQYSIMPMAGASNVGTVQYIGTTDSTYTHNYFYENVATAVYDSTVSFEAATLSSSTIACSGSDFAAFVAEWGSGDITTITHGTLTYDQSGGLLVFVGKDTEETTVCTFQLYTEDYQDAGFTITGTLQDGDVFAFTTAITESFTYAWSRKDVQPAQVNSDWNANSGVAQILNKPTIPDAIQVSSMPTAAVGELGKVYQFIGTTDANYTHGYFYECVSDGQNPATYSWTRIDVQPGGSSLPDPTNYSGRYLTNDGTNVSWSSKPPLLNQYNKWFSEGDVSYCIGSGTGSNKSQTDLILYGRNCVVVNGGSNSVMIGSSTTVNGTYTTAVGYGATVGITGQTSSYGTAVGYNAIVRAERAIQLGAGTNLTANTFCVGNVNGNFRMMDADGTIPTDRYTTTPSADGTYVPTLTISSGVATRSWSAPGGGGSTAATGTLVAADWSSSSQTINVTGVTASNNVIVAPAPASQAAYTAAGIVCTAQGAGTLSFSCASTPASDLTVNVLIM